MAGWALKKKGTAGYVVTWDGQEYGMAPATREWCHLYVERLRARYPGGGKWLLRHNPKSRVRGGPWRYTLADGTSEVIHTGRLTDAKGVLRHRLRRKTLPRGIKWNLEEDA